MKTKEELQQLLQQPLVKLNLGSGNDIRLNSEGWINIDALDGIGVDVVADVTKLEMFPDECVELIESNHCIEHVGSWKTSLDILKEWTR